MGNDIGLLASLNSVAGGALDPMFANAAPLIPSSAARQLPISPYMMEAYNRMAQARREEMIRFLSTGRVEVDGKVMKYTFKTFGSRPANGYMLFYGMHGGGGTTKEVNDQQW